MHNVYNMTYEFNLTFIISAGPSKQTTLFSSLLDKDSLHYFS